MSTLIGVIAEDNSDIDVVDEFIRKIVPKKKYIIKSFVGHGCGKVRGKCFQWAGVLKTKGCSCLILLHDLDEHDLPSLNTHLCQVLAHCSISKHVVIIPIREIEAWLLSDNKAIKKAMNLVRDVPRISNPQEIVDPKRKLGETIYLLSDKTKRYLNSVHNRKIAAAVELVNVRRCSSFLPLESFLIDNLR